MTLEIALGLVAAIVGLAILAAYSWSWRELQRLIRERQETQAIIHALQRDLAKARDKVPIDLPHDYGATVWADGVIDARITGYCYRRGSTEIEISYWSNGDLKTIWIQDWRICVVPT